MGQAETLTATRKALRLTSGEFDDEIAELIGAARIALVNAGVKPEVAKSEDNAMVLLAVKVFAKANFGRDNPDSETLMASFNYLATQLKTATEYGELLDGV